MDAGCTPSLGWLLSLPTVAGPSSRWFAAEAGGGTGSIASPIRILIVEDDPDIAEMYRVQLQRDGYAVDIAGDSVQALRAIEAGPPGLVFLDILLPGRDGFSILAEVRERWRVPVVILSNYSDAEMIERGRRLGAREYLVKSRVTPTDLSRSIASWLDDPG